MEAENAIGSIVSSVQTNGAETTYNKIEEGEFDSNGFWPWLTEKPDTTLYSLEKLVPLNPSVLAAAHTQLETELDQGNTWTTVTLGTTEDTYLSIAKSANLSSTHYVSVLVKNTVPTDIICSGLTNAPCNAWKASELLATLKYDLNTKTIDAITTSLDGNEYVSGDLKPVVVGTAGGTLGDTSTAVTSWIDVAQVGDYRELSFTENGVAYGGWAVPVTLDDDTSYQMGITFVDTPDEALESTCAPTHVTPCVFTEAVSLASSVPSLTEDNISTALASLTITSGWTVEIYSSTKKYSVTSEVSEADDTTNFVTFGAHKNGWWQNSGKIYYIVENENADYLVVVPVANVVLDRSGTCTAAKKSDCSVTFQKSILGEVIRDSLFNDLTALKTKFTNGNYNADDWSVQLREISGGALEAYTSSNYAIPTDVTIYTVAAIASENSNGGFVQFNSEFGPYKTYVHKVLNNYYVQTGYVNSFTMAPTDSPSFAPTIPPTPEPTRKDSSISLAILTTILCFMAVN